MLFLVRGISKPSASISRKLPIHDVFRTAQDPLPICNKYVVVTNESKVSGFNSQCILTGRSENEHTVTARIVDDFSYDPDSPQHTIGFPSAGMKELGNGDVVNFIEKVKWHLA